MQKLNIKYQPVHQTSTPAAASCRAHNLQASAYKLFQGSVIAKPELKYSSINLQQIFLIPQATSSPTSVMTISVIQYFL
jgi:hypothetical protein